jgi:hypothetical protein
LPNVYFLENSTRQFFIWIKKEEVMIPTLSPMLSRRCYMDNENPHEENYIRKDDLHKGQKLIYKGEEAIVLDVNPVFVIKVTGKNQVVCGNILDDVSPLQGDRSNGAIKVSKAILKDTTNCRNNFACLSGETECMCEVIKSVSSYNAIVIKPKSIDSCKYFLPLDNTMYCLCPTKNEVYRRYHI